MNRILPYILATLTQHNRQKVEIIWSDISWVHNIFRAYELIFWRKEGVRCEISSGKDSGGDAWQTAHTFEGFCALVETGIRASLKGLIPQVTIVQVPAFITPYGAIMPSAYRFAIAFDASSSGNTGTGTSNTWSHTVTGSNPFLATVNSDNSGATGDLITSVTYAAANATQADVVTAAGGFPNISMWLKGNPSTGANNIVWTASGSTNFNGRATSYTGAQSSNTADAHGTGTASTVGNIIKSITTVADNCWLVSAANNSGSAPSGGTNTVQRVSAGTLGMGDSNGPQTPPGSFSQKYEAGVSVNWSIVVASCAPFSAAVNSKFLMFM